MQKRHNAFGAICAAAIVWYIASGVAAAQYKVPEPGSGDRSFADHLDVT